MKILVGSQVRTPALAKMEDVLKEWTRVIDRYTMDYHRSFPRRAVDNPYWNGERAAISSLAAAAWLTGGVALEEFGTKKGKGRRPRYGRSDLWILRRGTGFAIEAKLEWPNVGFGARGWVTLNHSISRWLDKAASDAEKTRTPEGLKVGALFVAPTLPAGDRLLIRERCTELVADLRLHHRNAAWWFLVGDSAFPTHERILYPGVALVLRKA